MELSLPRLRRLAVSEQSFRRLALASAIMLIVIVASGTTVRLTGSGLGCLHWPGCTANRFLPTTGGGSFHKIVEFSNRVVAGFTIVATLVAWLAALKTPGVPRWARWVAAGTFVGTLGQAPLGAVTIHYKLNPWLVMSHFLLSIVVLALGVLVALEAWGVRGEPVPRRVRQLSAVVAASCAALIVSGSVSTAAGPHSGSVDVPRVWRFEPAMWLHVRATAVFGIGFLILVAWLATRAPSHVRGALVVLGLLVVQMIIGEIQFRTHLPIGLVIVHVTLSAIVWAAAFAWVATLWRPNRIAT